LIYYEDLKDYKNRNRTESRNNNRSKKKKKRNYMCINNFAKISIHIFLSFTGKTTSSLEKNNNELVKPLKLSNT